MSTLTVPRNDTERVIAETIRTYWGLFLAQGIIMMVLGAAAIVWPQVSTFAVDLYAGWMFLISGIFGLLTMFSAPSAAAFFWSLLTAALSLFVGVLLLWHPVEGVVSLTLALIAFFIVEGVFQIAAAIGIARRCRTPGAGSDERHRRPGACRDDDLGVAIDRDLALGLVVGLNLLTSGLAIAMVAMRPAEWCAWRTSPR